MHRFKDSVFDELPLWIMGTGLAVGLLLPFLILPVYGAMRAISRDYTINSAGVRAPLDAPFTLEVVLRDPLAQRQQRGAEEAGPDDQQTAQRGHAPPLDLVRQLARQARRRREWGSSSGSSPATRRATATPPSSVTRYVNVSEP